MTFDVHSTFKVITDQNIGTLVTFDVHRTFKVISVGHATQDGSTFA